MFSILIVATSSTLSPQQNESNKKHLYFKQDSSFTSFIKSCLEIIVGIFLVILEDGNTSLFNFRWKQTE